MDNLLKNLESGARRSLSVLDNEYVNTFVKVFLAVYIAVWAPRLPGPLAALFKNNMFRLLMFFSVLYFATKDRIVALLIAVAFLVSMQSLRMFDQPAVAQVVQNVEESEDASEEEQEVDDSMMDNEMESDVPVAEEEPVENNQEVLGYEGSISGANH